MNKRAPHPIDLEKRFRVQLLSNPIEFEDIPEKIVMEGAERKGLGTWVEVRGEFLKRAEIALRDLQDEIDVLKEQHHAIDSCSSWQEADDAGLIEKCG